MTLSEICAAIIAVSQAITAGENLAFAQWDAMTKEQKQTEITRRQTLEEPGYLILKALSAQLVKLLGGSNGPA